jgi:hypothetical protein
MNLFAVLVIALGIFILALGTRLALLGAGVGALLGIGILRFLPGSQEPSGQLPEARSFWLPSTFSE